MSSREGVILSCSLEEAQQYYEQRERNDLAVSGYDIRVDLQDDPRQVYERLEGTELHIIPNKDYVNGSAQRDDDLLVITGESGVLLTAEHATWCIRRKTGGLTTPKGPEPGTAAIGNEVALDTNSSAIVAIGRQKGQPHKDRHHRFKDAMAEVIALPCSEAHLSIHGMRHGLAEQPLDTKGFSVLLGRGMSPSPATNALLDYMLETGKDLGLRVGVNQPFMEFDRKTKKPILTEEGLVKSTVYLAPPHTTRGYSQSLAEELGKGDSFAAVQIELSAALRLRGSEDRPWPSERDRVLGAYLGYLFVRSAANSVSKL
jgi:hypothetical protein